MQPRGSAVSRLGELASKLGSARSEHALAMVLVDDCTQVLESDSFGLVLFDAASPTINSRGTADAFIDDYFRYVCATDPIQKTVMEHHRATRDLDVATREQWLAHEHYSEIAIPYGMIRCMQGPVVGDGQVIGIICAARRSDAAFSDRDAMKLARLRSMPLALHRLRRVLTAREVEVSLLVAKGLTNQQIGHVLGVSANAIKGSLGRAFRKLGIESRVELVATLFDGL
jgi:DNA-binding NarL/FixJ family response regulator